MKANTAVHMVFNVFLSKSINSIKQSWMFLLLLTLLLVSFTVSPVFSAQSAVPTFECIGLYWSPGKSSATTCNVSYREVGSSGWKKGFPLWFDSKNLEYRGSLVNLKPKTNYEISLSLQDGTASTTLSATTWNEEFPIAKTVYLPSGVSSQTYTASESGTQSGYVLYVASPSSSTIDVSNKQPNCINVKASYVIIRGITCMGASNDAITLGSGVHDVVIDQCDISGWGRIAKDGFGIEMDAGVKAASGTNVQRIIVQYNKIHHPRSNSNDWTESRDGSGLYTGYHPGGPEAISFLTSTGNNVIRYNDVYSDESHCFNDAIGGGWNNSTQGFPGPNSDVYGNSVKSSNDDALEIDGGGCNVRIWGNYLDTTFVGISTTACSVGPLYVFRNVMAWSRQSPNSDVKGVFAKTGDQSAGVGRQYWFHNTVLQPGGAMGISSSGSGSVTMVVSKNNIWNCKYSIDVKNTSTSNDFDYDLCSGRIKAYSGVESHAVIGTPIYLSNYGSITNKSGIFQLDPKSPGYDAGIIIPNFNDGYTGAGPDMGAHEAGTSAMLFGLKALKKESTPVMVFSQAKRENSVSKSKVNFIVGTKSSAMHSPSQMAGSRIFNIQGRSISGKVINGSKDRVNASGIQIEKKMLKK
jgi:hypothetical protein